MLMLVSTHRQEFDSAKKLCRDLKIPNIVVANDPESIDLAVHVSNKLLKAASVAVISDRGDQWEYLKVLGLEHGAVVRITRIVNPRLN